METMGTATEVPPPAGYREAVTQAVVAERGGRVLLHMAGRAPGQMLSGIMTNRVPDPPTESSRGVRGDGVYSAILTPKGKLVTDLRAFRLEGDEEAFLLEIPQAGAEGTLAHFKKYLPPRLATVTDVSAELRGVAVVGPDAPARIAKLALHESSLAEELMEMGENEVLTVPGKGGHPLDGLRVIRTGELSVPTYDLLAPEDRIGAMVQELEEAGLPWLSGEGWRVLRIEAGRAVYGEELDSDTIVMEAGLEARAIDHGKGCYTGQEVVVRIRDRGRVNRHLRGLLFGDVAPPESGTELYIEGRERAGGVVRSAVGSPRFGQAAGLGYVRRELEPPGRARLGSPDGPEVEVRELTHHGWVLREDDPGG